MLAFLSFNAQLGIILALCLFCVLLLIAFVIWADIQVNQVQTAVKKLEKFFLDRDQRLFGYGEKTLSVDDMVQIMDGPPTLQGDHSGHDQFMKDVQAVADLTKEFQFEQHVNQVVATSDLLKQFRQPAVIDMDARFLDVRKALDSMDESLSLFGKNANTANLRRLVGDLELGYKLERQRTIPPVHRSTCDI